VWVTPTGDVLGYEQLAGPNLNITETPVLPNLLSLPVEGNTPQASAVGELEVTFNANGVVAVEPE